MNILKKYYWFFAIIIISGGLFLEYKTNSFEFQSKVLQVINNNQIELKEYISVENKYLVLKIISEACITFGITLIITMFFVNYFDKKEKTDFKSELKEIQKDTAKDAFLSLFNQIVDEAFFLTIKEDIINCKLIRKNAKWIYDIKKDDDGKLQLTRIIRYDLHNLSNEIKTENIEISFLHNEYAKSSIESVKIKKTGDDDYKDVQNLEETEKNGSKIKTGKIEIQPNEVISVVRTMVQTFSTSFIYETHFLNDPLADLELTVTVPDGYNFTLCNGPVTSNVTEEINDKNHKIFKFNKAILKGQGIEFFCNTDNS